MSCLAAPVVFFANRCVHARWSLELAALTFVPLLGIIPIIVTYERIASATRSRSSTSVFTFLHVDGLPPTVRENDSNANVRTSFEQKDVFDIRAGQIAHVYRFRRPVIMLGAIVALLLFAGIAILSSIALSESNRALAKNESKIRGVEEVIKADELIQQETARALARVQAENGSFSAFFGRLVGGFLAAAQSMIVTSISSVSLGDSKPNISFQATGKTPQQCYQEYYEWLKKPDMDKAEFEVRMKQMDDEISQYRIQESSLMRESAALKSRQSFALVLRAIAVTSAVLGVLIAVFVWNAKSPEFVYSVVVSMGPLPPYLPGDIKSLADSSHQLLPSAEPPASPTQS